MPDRKPDILQRILARKREEIAELTALITQAKALEKKEIEFTAA